MRAAWVHGPVSLLRLAGWLAAMFLTAATDASAERTVPSTGGSASRAFDAGFARGYGTIGADPEGDVELLRSWVMTALEDGLPSGHAGLSRETTAVTASAFAAVRPAIGCPRPSGDVRTLKRPVADAWAKAVGHPIPPPLHGELAGGLLGLTRRAGPACLCVTSTTRVDAIAKACASLRR